MRQPHAAPFDHVPLAGDQIDDRRAPARASPLGPMAISPKWNQNVRGPWPFSAIATATALSCADRFLDEADDLAVVDLRETQIAGLQQAPGSRAAAG